MEGKNTPQTFLLNRMKEIETETLQVFLMKDIQWYITENMVIPFVENNKGTKIKILTNNKIVKIHMEKRKISISPVDEADAIELVKDLKATLFKATRKKGDVISSINLLKEYCYKEYSYNYVRDRVNIETKTQEEIIQLAELISAKHKKSKENITRDSRDF